MVHAHLATRLQGRSRQCVNMGGTCSTTRHRQEGQCYCCCWSPLIIRQVAAALRCTHSTPNSDAPRQQGQQHSAQQAHTQHSTGTQHVPSLHACVGVIEGQGTQPSLAVTVAGGKRVKWLETEHRARQAWGGVTMVAVAHGRSNGGFWNIQVQNGKNALLHTV